jgi:hypothetical protein
MGSPDGIHWRLLHKQPIFADGRFDSQNVAFWHPLEGCYVAYVRVWQADRRWIGRAVSEDFITWSETEPIDGDLGPSEHLYTNATILYPGAPQLLLAFPQRFVPERRVIPEAPLPGVSDSVMMTSRGGRTFQSLFREALVRPGRDRRNWTDRSNMVAWGLLRTGGDELSLYVTRHYRHATAHLERCAVRLDGFVSVHAAGSGGQLVTRPLRFTGRALYLNYATSAIGSIQVEIQDAHGGPIAHRTLSDCQELVGDEVSAAVAWRGGGDLSALAGTPIRLCFRLHDADLYAIRFGGVGR